MLIQINDLKPNMMLAKEVYNKNNTIIMPARTLVTGRVINWLRYHEIGSVEVMSGAEGEPDNSVKSTEEFKRLQEDVHRLSRTMNTSFRNIIEGEYSKDDIKRLIDASMEIYGKNKDDVNLLDMLHYMREITDDTFIHSLNVGMIASTLAKWLDWPTNEVELLVTCGIFHDIGKLTVPQGILKKPGKLTPKEFGEMQKHTIKGYELIKDADLDDHIKQCALLHHEKCDGSGYPLHLKGDKIDRFVKVVTIADVYDAMTANRVYRKGLCPFEVISTFEEEGMQVYEISYLITFLQRVVTSFIRNQITLSDGRKGEVIMINERALSKPVIMVGEEFIDLSKNIDIKINSVEP